jgi:hypothetical protein
VCIKKKDTDIDASKAFENTERKVADCSYSISNSCEFKMEYFINHSLTFAGFKN